MPIYEYKCRACGSQWEDLASVDAPLPHCPCCEGGPVERLMPRRIATVTDRELFRNRGTLADQFEGVEDQLHYVVSQARRHGYNPGINDVYMPALADFPGDPAAFVSPTDGRGHIKKVVASRGEDCEGIVNYKAPRGTRGEEPPKLAPDLVEDAVDAMIEENPSLALKDRDDLRQQVIEKHGAPD